MGEVTPDCAADRGTYARAVEARISSHGRWGCAEELYSELQAADGVMVPLLRFLFTSALHPYWTQIQRWLFLGKVHDPCEELHLPGTATVHTAAAP